jgi:hypothetical protein
VAQPQRKFGGKAKGFDAGDWPSAAGSGMPATAPAAPMVLANSRRVKRFNRHRLS